MWKASAHKYYQIFHPDIKSRNIGVHFCKILDLFIIFAVYVSKVYLIYYSANVVQWMSSCSKGTVRRLMQCERSGILLIVFVPVYAHAALLLSLSAKDLYKMNH